MSVSTISVVMPVFNGAKYLAAAIESVLGQTVPPGELIVVDDGSTDESAAIAASYGGVTLVRQENRGTAAARNAGLRLARGEFLAHMDADDLWAPDKLALQLEALREEPALDAVAGAIREFVSPDTPEEARAAMRAPRDVMPGHLLQAMLLRREAHERVGEFEEQWAIAQDMSWYMRAMEAGLRLRVLDAVVVHRRLHASNKGVTQRHHGRQRLEILKSALDRRRQQS